MLSELLAGRLPFIANEPIGVISQHLYAPVVPASTYNTKISPALDAIILRLMSKDPRDRPASAEAVRQALMRLEAPVVAETVEAVLPLERIALGRMVGRVKELKEVQLLWRGAALGQGRVLLISGEPGIGKTRLVRELSARVEISGGTALAAACYAESGAPYAPVAQLIRSAFSVANKPDGQKLITLSEVEASDVGISRGTSSSFSAAGLRLNVAEQNQRTSLDLPETTLDALGMLAPDCCGEPRELRDRPELDPHADQERLFDSLVQLFQALARRAPLLIVLEDVHWADSGTHSMVRRLSRHVPGMPLLLALTYREVELGESRVLSDLLYELSRQRQGERIKLTRLSRYEAGDLDFVGLKPENVERMRYRYPGEYISSPISGLSFIGFNQAYPPLDDVRVRRALVHATDRRAIVDLLAHGYPTPVASGFLPPGNPGHSPDTGLGYDLELARDLLAQAGFPGGKGFPELNLYMFKSKELGRMGEFVQRGWQETLGITLQLQDCDLIENFHTYNLAGLWHITWVADYPDADNFLRVALGHYQVLQYWKNPMFNRLVEEARLCLEPQRRAEMYHDADRLLTEEAVLMPLNYFRRHMLIKPWVKNFRPGMQHYFFLKDVILDV